VRRLSHGPQIPRARDWARGFFVWGSDGSGHVMVVVRFWGLDGLDEVVQRVWV
jgi:hypothetical protein